jgi:hypothetical protein
LEAPLQPAKRIAAAKEIKLVFPNISSRNSLSVENSGLIV